MRVEISEMPSSPYEIFVSGEDATIKFWENPEKIIKPESTTWAVDEYKIHIKNRKTLQDSIEANIQAWIEMAKAQGEIPPPRTVEERVTTVEETIDTIFGGAV